MRVLLNRRYWDHIPTLAELQDNLNPELDAELTGYEKLIDLDAALRLVGLRIFTDGDKIFSSETKYYISDTGELVFPDYKQPTETDCILN